MCHPTHFLRPATATGRGRRACDLCLRPQLGPWQQPVGDHVLRRFRHTSLGGRVMPTTLKADDQGDRHESTKR